MDWKQNIIIQLQKRDSSINENQDLLSSYHDVLNRLFATEDKLKSLQKTDLQIELTKTISEFEILKTKNQQLTNSYDLTKSINEKQDKEIKQLNHKIKRLQDVSNKLNDQISVKIEENRAKSKALDLVNDDMLALQLENNLMNEKTKELQAENDQLVIRWMDKVREDAEKLNDANAFLASARLERNP